METTQSEALGLRYQAVLSRCTPADSVGDSPFLSVWHGAAGGWWTLSKSQLPWYFAGGEKVPMDVGLTGITDLTPRAKGEARGYHCEYVPDCMSVYIYICLVV